MFASLASTRSPSSSVSPNSSPESSLEVSRFRASGATRTSLRRPTADAAPPSPPPCRSRGRRAESPGRSRSRRRRRVRAPPFGFPRRRRQPPTSRRRPPGSDDRRTRVSRCPRGRSRDAWRATRPFPIGRRRRPSHPEAAARSRRAVSKTAGTPNPAPAAPSPAPAGPPKTSARRYPAWGTRGRVPRTRPRRSPPRDRTWERATRSTRTYRPRHRRRRRTSPASGGTRTAPARTRERRRRTDRTCRSRASRPTRASTRPSTRARGPVAARCARSRQSLSSARVAR